MYDKRKRDDAKMEKLGRKGERLVEAFFEMQDCDVCMSGDKFDSYKDMTIDGETVEVKTQIPMIVKKSFMVNQDQYWKCSQVNRLFFIEIPYDNRYGKNSTVNIYECPPSNRDAEKYITKDGRHMLMYPIEECELIGRISNKKICNDFANLSNSQV
jgi:hypothetical protein